MNRVPSQSEIDGNDMSVLKKPNEFLLKSMLKSNSHLYKNLELRTAFVLMDQDRNGRITALEVQSMLQQLGINLREDIVLNLVRQASQSGKMIAISFN